MILGAMSWPGAAHTSRPTRSIPGDAAVSRAVAVLALHNERVIAVPVVLLHAPLPGRVGLAVALADDAGVHPTAAGCIPNSPVEPTLTHCNTHRIARLLAVLGLSTNVLPAVSSFSLLRVQARGERTARRLHTHAVYYVGPSSVVTLDPQW